VGAHFRERGQKTIVTYKDIPHNYIVVAMMEIDRIRQIARERGIDLQVQGLVCLPREIRNFAMVYVAIIEHRNF